MLKKIDGQINIVEDLTNILKTREGVVVAPTRGTSENGTHQGGRVQALQL